MFGPLADFDGLLFLADCLSTASASGEPAKTLVQGPDVRRVDMCKVREPTFHDDVVVLVSSDADVSLSLLCVDVHGVLRYVVDREGRGFAGASELVVRMRELIV